MSIIRLFVVCFILLFSLVESIRPQDKLEEGKVFTMTLDELLEAEVVSASGHAQTVTRAPATIISIDCNQIEERGYDTLEDLLRELPGFDLTRTLGAFPTLHTIRGSYGDENKRLMLLVDGFEENNIIGSFEMAGPAYSLHHVERVEIILGPASALYGANAFSGIINIITKQGKKHEGFRYDKGYGSFNSRFDKFSLVTTGKKLDLSLSGSLFNSDGPCFSNRHPDFSDAYVDNAVALTGRLTLKHKGNHLSFGFHMFDTPMGDGTFGLTATRVLGLPDMGRQNQGNVGWLSADINGEKPSLWHHYTRTFHLTSRFYLKENLYFNSKVYFRETGLADDTYSYLTLGGNVFTKNHLTHQSFRTGGEMQLVFQGSGKYGFTAGLIYFNDNIEKDYRAITRDTAIYPYRDIFLTNLNPVFHPREHTIQQNYGIYAQYQLETRLLNYTSFTLGSRYDYNSLYGATFNPRVGIVSKPFKNFTAKILYGEAYRAPGSFEVYSTGPIRIINEDLKPEKIRAYELDLSYKMKKLLFRCSLFYNRLTDLIVQDVPAAPGIEQNRNAGKAVIKGMELYADYVVSDNLKGFANFSFQEGEQQNVGSEAFRIPNIASVKGNFGITYRFPELLNIYLSANWVGRRSVPKSNPLGGIPAYMVINFSLTSKRFFNNRISTGIVVENLLNTTYFDPGIRSASGSFIWSTIHEQPGTNVRLRLSLHY